VHAERARPPRAPARPPRPDFITESPLISVITPTYNRREDLKKMLSCIAAQTYTNVESIVVNDGGEAVDDIVAAYPFAKLINLDKNTGGMRALAIGRDHARGEYIGILPDDDWYYPDHFERLMNAIFRSGCSIAHGTALLRYLEQTETGAWRTSGFNATTFSETLAPTDALVTSTVGGNQLVVPARVYEELGWYIADSDVADNEIHARWAAHYFYAFVDHVTSEFRDHEGSMGRSLDFVTALKRVYSELHPRPDRPLLNHIREATIENVRQREAGKSAFSPTIRLKKTPD
jgi:glycosyltransferase involved in cell wall biosynthesis